MSVYYKFKTSQSYDTIKFDGLHISLGDLKKAIYHQKQIGKNPDFDLLVTNAQDNQVYSDDNELINRNASVIVVRIPLTPKQIRARDRIEAQQNLIKLKQEARQIKYAQAHGGGPGANHRNAADLLNENLSEQDRISCMISQATSDYDPSNYVRVRGNHFGPAPKTYVCHLCNKGGHWKRDCPTLPQRVIYDSFEYVFEFMLAHCDLLHCSVISSEAYQQSSMKKADTGPPVEMEKAQIPEDLVCILCQDLMVDAVMIPCCGISFCDECIRNLLLESDEHECPDCKEKDVSPDTLIPNRFLRNKVNDFKKEKGYERPQPKTATPTPAPAHQETPVPLNSGPSHPVSSPLSDGRNISVLGGEDKTPPSGNKEEVQIIGGGEIPASNQRHPNQRSPHHHPQPQVPPQQQQHPQHPPQQQQHQHPPQQQHLPPHSQPQPHPQTQPYPQYAHPPAQPSGPPGYLPPPAQQLPPLEPPPGLTLPPPRGYMPPAYPGAPPQPQPGYLPPPQAPHVHPSHYNSRRRYEDDRYERDSRYRRPDIPSGVIDDTLSVFNQIMDKMDEHKKHHGPGPANATKPGPTSRSKSYSRSPGGSVSPDKKKKKKAKAGSRSRSRSRSAGSRRSRSVSRAKKSSRSLSPKPGKKSKRSPRSRSSRSRSRSPIQRSGSRSRSRSRKRMRSSRSRSRSRSPMKYGRPSYSRSRSHSPYPYKERPDREAAYSSRYGRSHSRPRDGGFSPRDNYSPPRDEFRSPPYHARRRSRSPPPRYRKDYSPGPPIPPAGSYYEPAAPDRDRSEYRARSGDRDFPPHREFSRLNDRGGDFRDRPPNMRDREFGPRGGRPWRGGRGRRGGRFRDDGYFERHGGPPFNQGGDRYLFLFFRFYASLCILGLLVRRLPYLNRKRLSLQILFIFWLPPLLV
ncbi:E3 ubiquitin-protein ligase RBBP6 [Diaphorina citri]|uniref:E3 ubiquitin-protein ligase RBBP6 n=1 Tax=Diaphorina citri TaxID=121845 RepID=A0A3Q0IRZ6_DIACI|nr:E3 ubiquitin-protein ligase RBBP6 [Diaphorina citri]